MRRYVYIYVFNSLLSLCWGWLVTHKQHSPCLIIAMGAGIACWLGCWIRDRKVAGSNLSRSGGRIFFSRVNFVCWLLFGVRSTPVLPQWHTKDPGHSAKSAGGRLHLNTHTSWPNEVGVGWLCHCPGIVWEPIRKLAHTQLIRKHLVTVVSARWATVDWSWPKQWN